MHLLLEQVYHNLAAKPAEKTYLPSFYGSSAGLAIAEIAQQKNNLIVVITKDLQTANKLAEEVSFFTATHENLPIFTFPDWETLPYDHFSPHQDIISQRLLTLYKLPLLKQGIVITAITTLMSHLAPPEYITKNSFVLSQGDKLNIDQLRHNLEQQGYRCVNKVMEHGEFAVRGSLIDIFPMGSRQPLRIDLYDDTVDSIRLFDVETQLTTVKTTSIQLLPAKEFPLTNEAIAYFRQNWRTNFSGDPTNCPVYQSISNGESPNGIEYYLPLFFPITSSFVDYLPHNSTIITIDDTYTSASNFWQEIKKRHNELQHDITHPILAPANIFWTVDEIFGTLKQLPQIQITTDGQPISGHTQDSFSEKDTFISKLPSVNANHKLTQPLTNLATFLNTFSGNILFCAESKGRLETLNDTLKTITINTHYCSNWQEFLNAQKKYNISIAALDQGFIITDSGNNNKLAIVSEADIFGQHLVLQRRYRKQQKQIDPENIVRDLAELRPGAPVVHIEHGIGNYLGLQTIETDGIATEFLTIAYANNAKLYVPVSSLHLISRYTGAGAENVPYDVLGSDKWQKTKRKALEKIRDVAAELLALYAKRAAKSGTALTFPPLEYQKFADIFPFEETPDQKQAIAAIIADMTAPRHMDRLICGDVGFGKTEVAMRATFIAAYNGCQVAVLVPTTILAQQHYLNFKDRFADWPFKIELISRVRSATEQKNILEQLKNGKIDIIIGTHKLLQPTIQFKNLGLLIIDEEHRFGVKQKERIKELRPEVDLLTLTATPIPRTLNMALAGIRDFSIIASPPARRLAIKTFIYDRHNDIIREAIWREILRGGQVYFLHNDVATIEKTAQELLRLIPTIKVTVAHGQMREHQLEQIMRDFYHGRFNVLVCTTIIESGIDVPTANTIIIDRADRLGLAQLHQIRGRVGRSHHQAYAYLLVPSQKLLSSDATRRLEAIAAMENLGAGFNLATHDLEIRGAGELLGAEQSGNMESIGFSLYMEYLEAAVDALKQGKELQLYELEKSHAIVEIKIPALFPEDYIIDINTRLTLYKRLANTKNHEEINILKEEIIDRFGILPEASKNLFRITAIKQQAEKLGIKKINANKNSGYIEFNAKPNIEPVKIINLIQKQSKIYKLHGANKLAFNVPTAQHEQQIPNIILNFLTNLLDELSRT